MENFIRGWQTTVGFKENWFKKPTLVNKDITEYLCYAIKAMSVTMIANENARKCK